MNVWRTTMLVQVTANILTWNLEQYMYFDILTQQKKEDFSLNRLLSSQSSWTVSIWTENGHMAHAEALNAIKKLSQKCDKIKICPLHKKLLGMLHCIDNATMATPNDIELFKSN